MKKLRRALHKFEIVLNEVTFDKNALAVVYHLAQEWG
jgi:hypothetical protein